MPGIKDDGKVEFGERDHKGHFCSHGIFLYVKQYFCGAKDVMLRLAHMLDECYTPGKFCILTVAVVIQSAHVIKIMLTLYQCQFPCLGHFPMVTYDTVRWGEMDEGYTNPFCTVFATLVNPLLVQRLKESFKELNYPPY